jgi:tetratricopeptide (TPR) repeat protein
LIKLQTMILRFYPLSTRASCGALWLLGLLFTVSCAIPTGYLATGFVPQRDLRATQLVYRGVSDFSRSRFEQACEYFSEALELNPNSPTIQHNLTLSHFRLGAYDEAESSWHRLIRQHPENPDFYFELGNLYAARNDYAKALEQLDVSLQKRLKLDREREGKTEDEKAKETLFIKANPVEKPPILAAMMEVAWRGGEWDRARCYAQQSALEELAVNKGAAYSAVVRAAQVLSNMGDIEIAENLIRKNVPEVVQLRSASVAHALALIAFEKENYKEFIKGELNALQAFDLEEDLRIEIEYLNSLLLKPFDTLPPSTSRIVTSFWPPSLQVLTLGVNWDEAEEDKVRAIGKRLNRTLKEKGAIEDKIKWWRFW